MDLKEIKRVIQMVEEAQISHFSMEIEGTKIEVKKEWGAVGHSYAPLSPAIHAIASPGLSQGVSDAHASSTPATPIEGASDAGLIAIKSQMVGTFYLTAKPDSPPYVKVGDTISVGQVLCIIEAMKLFNEIESDHSGIIEKICIETGAPVEYGQTLFMIRV